MKKQVNVAHARNAKQRHIMEQSVRDGVCPFCREHLEHYHGKPILLETRYWVVTENFFPYKGTKTHLLFIAKKHCEGFWELSKEAQADLFSLADKMRDTYHIPGGTLLMRWGDTDYTGASIAHLHVQMVSGDVRTKSAEPILTAVGYEDAKRATPPE